MLVVIGIYEGERIYSLFGGSDHIQVGKGADHPIDITLRFHRFVIGFIM